MTSRQFYIMLSLFVISTKMQRLPSLLSSEFGKNGYLLVIFYFFINIVGILLAFFIYRFLDREKFNNEKTGSFFRLIKKLIMLATSIYFIVQALLLFEHVQTIFADTLFDKFAWSIFSLLFLFAIFYLAKTGIKNIALNYEIYALLIFGSLFLISVLGATQADFTMVLPFEDINFSKIISSSSKFNIWFGDFFIILYMLFHTNKPKLKKTLLFYSLSILFVVFLIIAFIGVYGDYAAIQSGLVATITEQSMLGVNIGRVDWFLILIAELATILSSSVCIYFANKTMCVVFPKIKSLYIAIFIAVIFYILNVFVLVDKLVVKEFFFGIGGSMSLLLKFGSVLLLWIIAICDYYNDKKKRRNCYGQIS